VIVLEADAHRATVLQLAEQDFVRQPVPDLRLHQSGQRAWLAIRGYDPVYGARPLARLVQTEVRDRLTDEILFGQLEHGGTVCIGLEDDHLAFSFEAATPVA